MIVTATVDGYAIHRANDTFVEDWGGLGAPDVRTVRQPAPRRHGAIDATALYGPRIMPVRGWCGDVPEAGVGPAAAVAAFDALKAALTAESQHVVVLRRAGRAVDERLVCRLASGITDSVEGAGEVIRWSFDLIAADPLLYDATEASAQRTGAGSWTATVTGGTVPTLPRIEITGPTNTGTITLTSTTDDLKAVSLTNVQSLTAGQVAIVDFSPRTVFHHGAYHPENVAASSTDWWRLRPGANTISVAGTALQASTVIRAYWRPARI